MNGETCVYHNGRDEYKRSKSTNCRLAFSPGFFGLACAPANRSIVNGISPENLAKIKHPSKQDMRAARFPDFSGSQFSISLCPYPGVYAFCTHPEINRWRKQRQRWSPVGTQPCQATQQIIAITYSADAEKWRIISHSRPGYTGANTRKAVRLGAVFFPHLSCVTDFPRGPHLAYQMR